MLDVFGILTACFFHSLKPIRKAWNRWAKQQVVYCTSAYYSTILPGEVSKLYWEFKQLCKNMLHIKLHNEH